MRQAGARLIFCHKQSLHKQAEPQGPLRATTTHFPTPQREEPPRRKAGCRHCRARVCRVHRCRWPAGFLKRTYRPAISPGDSSRESREVRSPERDELTNERTDVTHHVADLRPPGQNLRDSRKPALRAGTIVMRGPQHIRKCTAGLYC